MQLRHLRPQLCLVLLTVIMLSYKSPAVKIIKSSAKFLPTPSIHVAPLTANDESSPEETHTDQASKNLIFGLQHSFENYKDSRQRKSVTSLKLILFQ